MPDYELERQAGEDGFALVAGVDEAGRGPWAGPVVAGAVILDIAHVPDGLLAALDDSKKLSAKRRDQLFEQLRECDGVVWGAGEASVEEIDGMNILAATMLAMRRAIDALPKAPDMALVDGNKT
ncbi:MAG: ribonuclease HII, partial [Rhodospirillales bacterium]|nr:ribonuclease HII [Rhodospirillales bacterium]MCW8862721.1 ribonuclease HII [Rhodospirillales bacterium]MCW9001617.1 ribonuclease HII [Rhodospirillales bacterium]